MEDIRILGQGVPDPGRHESQHIDHVAHAKPGIKVFPDRLYVITPISNFQRYRTRYELYRQFEKHVEESGAILYTIEAAFGHRPFEITTPSNPRDIQVRVVHELWLKENLINVAMSRLPPDWQYVAWIDADVKFVREDWAQETLHQLQHYQFVQMWSQIQDMSPDFTVIPSNYPNSYMYNWVNRVEVPTGSGGFPLDDDVAEHKHHKHHHHHHHHHHHPHPPPYPSNKFWYGPPGLAWAARREAIDAVGGLIDWAIVGSSDAYMAAALIGGVQHQLRREYHPSFNKRFMVWQDHAEQRIRRNVGYVPGLALHYWHGNKDNRKYIDRNKILSRWQFDPDLDIKRDWQGVYQLADHGDARSIGLRDALREYFRLRDEDSTHVG